MKTQAEIEKLFIPHLHKEEEFRWIGAPKQNFWRVNLAQMSPIIYIIGVAFFFFLRMSIFEDSNQSMDTVLFFGLVYGSVIPLGMWQEVNKHLISSSLFHRSYYIITNQRVLTTERGNIQNYSLMLVADAAIAKPKNGASTILIYDKANPTGQLPEPIFQLKGIAEEEAQAAYEILRQAREEALEDRAREMGIE